MPYITQEDQRRIDQIISDLGQRLGVSYPESSLVEMAEAAGVRVIETNLHNMRPSLSGAITYDDPILKTNPIIYIQEDLPPKRKRFTLAHELGHHFLHTGDKLRLDDFDYSTNDEDALQESEANYFAASLLIPKNVLKEKMKKVQNTKALADFFEVSTAAMENRLKWISKN